MDDTILQVKNLTVAFKEFTVLQDINLDIKRGKIYSIIGCNGCGKTTLIRTMSRNLKPKKGEILLEGKNIFKTNTKEVAKKMAILGQSNTGMGDITVRTLGSYGRFAHKKWWESEGGNDREIVDWALKKTGVEHLQNRKVNVLSGGERQRAWLAMAIAQKPEIMILDEPTTYLDIAHQLEIMELVKKLNEEEHITIVMVLHDMNHAARYSDEMIVIDGTHVFNQDNPWKILESGVLEDVFNVEADILKDEDTGKPFFYARKVIEK